MEVIDKVDGEMAYVVVHKYVEPNLRELKRNENADCCRCALSEKKRILGGEEEYLCKAALYDIETLACFVPKESCNE